MSSLKIIGAGLAGLIAANILRRHRPLVLERQPSLPHNHGAVLRFRTPAVSNATGIPFQKILVHKGIWDGERTLNETTIPLANQYSANVTDGCYVDRSVWNLATEVRYLAPANFPELIAAGLDIRYGIPFEGKLEDEVVISTLPMPVLATVLGYGSFQSFNYQPISTLRWDLGEGININQTIYNGSRDGWWYRATIEGSVLIIECVNGNILAWTTIRDSVQDVLFHTFGVQVPSPREEDIVWKKQEFGKLLPISENARKAFIRWASTEHNVYSLGRYATWRQGLLLDDLVKDVEIIDQLAFKSTASDRNYQIALK